MARALVASVLVVLAAAGGRGAAATPAPLGSCGPIARRHEAIEVRWTTLKRLGPVPLGHVGLVTMREGRIVPIPLQIDERQGRKIALAEGDEPSTDGTPGVLDPDDLLVFLPCDAGARTTAEALAAAVPGLVTWREIQLDDPLDGHRGFAYVVVTEAPPISARRYVAYDPQDDTVEAAAYRMDMTHALPSSFALAMRGPLGPNLLDGFRLRAEATLLGNLATLRLTEDGARHTLIAWKAGAVRIVRRSRHDVRLPGIGVHISAGVATTAFYPLHVFGPGALKLPISPRILFRDIQGMGGVDLRDLRGWRFVAAGTPPDGFAIDGAMDDLERAFTADGTWFALVHDDEALLVTITLSENLARAIPFGIVYLDDAQRRDPPEREPGSMPLVGFRGRHLEALTADRYRFDLRVFLLPGYRPGDAARVLAERDRPVVPTISAPPLLATAPASPR